MHLIKIRTIDSGLIVELSQLLSEVLRNGDDQDVLVASELARAISNDATLSEQDITFELDAVSIGHWSEQASIAAGLGKNCPFGLDLRIQGVLGKEKTKLTLRWLKPGTSIGLTSTPVIKGASISLGDHHFRLQDPFPSVISLVNQFNNLTSEQAHLQFEVWSKIRQSLGDKQVSQVSDHFLRALRILTCDAFTLNIAQEKDGSLQVVPRLLLEPNELESSSERQAALPEKDEAILASRLDMLPSGTNTFPVSDGVYVVAKPSVADSLLAIKEIRKWSPNKRKDAFLKPIATISEVLADLGRESSSIPFIETDSYSARVIDIGAWTPPVVPWLKLPSQPWLPPEVQGILIGDIELTLTKEEIKELDRQVKGAIEVGESEVEFNGQNIPANIQTVAALDELAKAVEKRTETGETAEPSDLAKEPKLKKDVSALLIKTNFESNDFNVIRAKCRPGEFNLPSHLKSSPKEHQLFGIRWLQAHWKVGSKGALLADDMGLGKTYQALAFLSWIKEMMAEGLYPNRPILIIAPVGLLKNWEEEHSIHLMGGGLGEVVRLYGKHLQDIKRGSHKAGTASLDTKKLNNADWILANYETVSDYQLALGAVHFSAVIFDEAQKIKSPQARMTHAAKALHSDFNLVVTGTPVENRMADFWCLADTAQPYCLGDLKSFSKKYESESSQEAIKLLKDQVWQDTELSEEQPKLMLRRLKSDNLKGLPRKDEVFLQRPMPFAQAEPYAKVIEIHRSGTDKDKAVGNKVTMLEIIQHLRQVSLHPSLYTKDRGLIKFEESARFQLLFEVLDTVAAKNEKALIFLESLALQDADMLPAYLLRRYNMPRLPLIINGDVETSDRQSRVHQFQTGHGFDIMILSPKAGGVGLTLTAANHVIHLSRWWNPAVEDQCSDRVYRIGQTRDVSIYYPMATFPDQPEFSFDVKLNDLMQRKKKLSGQLLMPSQISKDEFSTLLG